MQSTQTAETTTWPELAIGLYDKLTGRGAEITYQFDDLRITVPSRAGPDSRAAQWQVAGTLRISTRNAEKR